MKNRQWLLAHRPQGLIQPGDFEWKEQELRELGEGEVLLRNLYLSLDPANRGWLAESGSYMAPAELGSVVPGICLGEVVQSNNPKFAPGDLVQAMIGWQDYLISSGRGLSSLQRLPGLPLTAYMALFSHIGLTAYFGLLDIGQPQEGETLVVSAAAGAVGSLAGQIGKIKGCRVVGIAGSDDKCHWLTEELGFDAAINYKTQDVRKELKTTCPKGIDVIFENVGGSILDAEMSLMNLHARIVLCGLISAYNATTPPPGPAYFSYLITRRCKAQGFIVSDYMHRAMEAIPELAAWYMEGRLKYRVDEVEGLENAPTAINKLFDGSNQGKLVVKVH